MQVFSANTETYDEVFVNNYKTLLKFCNNETDRLNQTYIDVRLRLETKPFTAHTLTEIPIQLLKYIKTSLFNDWKQTKRLEKHTVTPDECKTELEYKLLYDHMWNEDCETKQQVLEYQSMKLFEYIKRNYDEESNYIFVTYWLYDANNKKITYAQLSEITGYSISKCCKIIKTIKQDLRTNLINYIING